MVALVIFLALLLQHPGWAASWSDSGVDLGIGFMGMKPIAGGAKVQPKGLSELSDSYSAATEQSVTGLAIHLRPSKAYPVIGRFRFTEEGFLGIQTELGFYPLREIGIPLGDETYALIVRKRQGDWVEIILQQAPVSSGWVRLTAESPITFWLWYSYFSSIVKAGEPLFFITPVRDDLLYQPRSDSLSLLKNLFQLEETILYPKRIEGAYMLVELGEPTGCREMLPRFERIKPARAWIRWLQNNGRPTIFRYVPEICP